MKSLSRADALSPEEKLEYLVLTALDPDAAAHYSAAGSAQARTDYLDWFWSRATGPAVLPRETYLDRARRARDLFGSIDLLADGRVSAYVRYGPPRREVYEPRPVENESVRVFTNPAETWTYDSLGLQFDFVRTGTAFRQVGSTRFGRNWFPPAFEQVDLGRPVPGPAAGSRELRLDASLGRLQQQGDSVEVELQYGIAASDPALVPERQNLFHFRFEFSARGREVLTRGFWAGATPAGPDGLVVGRETFRLPAEVYDVAIEAVSADGQARARRTRNLNLVDYVRRQQPTSDMLFYSLADSTFQSPQFCRADWLRVVPLVKPEVSAGSTFYVLYEVYNLSADPAGEHRLEAAYEIVEQPSGRHAVVPVPTRFVTGLGTTGVCVERVHTMDLRPGRYLLVSRIRDLNSDRTSSATAEFSILPRDQ